MIKRLLNRLTLSLLFALMLLLQMLCVFAMVGGVAYAGLALGLIDERNPRGMILIVFVACILMGLVTVFAFSTRSMKPFQRIIDAVETISKGDFSVRVPGSSIAAFALFAKSFNRMAEELGGIEVLRNDFINNFSHEFKTPIVSIQGFAEMLKREDLTEAQRREYLDIVIDESTRLSALATNTLNLTKIEAQSILTDTQSYNIGEQLRQCVLLLDAGFAKKQLRLRSNIDDVQGIGNREMLSQVFVNLLDNAIKFTKEHGAVEVSLKERLSSVVFIVRDTGCGITEAALPHVFDRFYQADTSHATHGNGIGLAVVHKIVKLHQGEITVVSQPGEGTTVMVTLPK